MTAFRRLSEALGDRVTRVHDGELSARCPAHDDGTASLTVTDAKGKALVHCHAGCTAEAIVGALGLRLSDLFDQQIAPRTIAAARRQVATYQYHDEDGTVLFEKVRYEPKDFRIRRPNPAGGWIWNRKGVRPVLYRLPAIDEAIRKGERIFEVEGEKDVHTLEQHGLVATCNADGAAKDGQRPKWGVPEAEQLSGAREVVVVPDNDAAGEAHAEAIVRSLAALTPAPIIRVLRLPGLPAKGDVSDWFASGGTREEFLALVDATEPYAVGERPAAAADDAEEGLGPDITEDGLALSFTDQHRARLRFCAAIGGWQVYDGVRWLRDDTRLTYSYARQLVRDVAQRTALAPKQYAKLRSGTTVNAIVSLASSDRIHAVTADAFDADPWLLNTPGGAVDLRTGRLRPCDPLDYCTKTTTASPAGDAPRWRQFLHEVTGGDPALVAYLHRLVGYWLTGVTSEHALVFVYGTGGNGKSVFLNAVLQLIGPYGRQAPMSLFEAKQQDGHPTELAMLRGTRLVVATETEEGRSWAESRIKVMTGGDPITARFMRGDFFTYLPQFKPVIAGNHRPRFRNPDEAIRRRLHLVPFTQRFSEPDRELPARLQAEAAGILAWAIEGCLAWQERGLQPPDVVRVATDDYLEQEDSVGAWLAECCDIQPNAWCPSSALWDSWERWANARGEFVGSQKRLAERLIGRGFIGAKDSSGTRRGFRGLTVGIDLTPSGHVGRELAISTSHARAHDAHAGAPTGAGARVGRPKYEAVSDVSGGFVCVKCRDPLKLFGVPDVVCMDCRQGSEASAA
jgi:putative DNA primase/helicase